MKINKFLDSYLGRQTKVALIDLPKIAKEWGYRFDCNCAFYNRYSDDYSHIVGYVLDEEKRTITFYSGFLDNFCNYIKNFYGYFDYLNLLVFLRTIRQNIVEFSNCNPSSNYQIFSGYSDYLEEDG